jgi:hypothetical protein
MSCYYSGAGNGSNCYELYDKTQLAPDIELIGQIIEEAINTLGQKIDYYVNTYNPLSADNIYGEQPTSIFNGPHQLKMYIELNENALALSKFGYNADDDITGYLSISGFRTAFNSTTVYSDLNQDIEPKSGDVFQMKEYGNDRPGNRAGNYFQITERVDQDIASLNPLGGHYTWRIKGKRLEYTFQPGLTGERGNDQVHDATFSGIISSTIIGQLSSAAKVYTEDVDQDSIAYVLDQTVNDTDVYGGY